MYRPVASARTLVAILGLCVATLASAEGSMDNWSPGTNYLPVPQPRTPQVARGKVEVNEIFWYGCSHCYALDPSLEKWSKAKPAYIEFVRTPVIWGPVHRQHARLFYTLQSLKRTDLHITVFEAIHRQGNMLAARNDAEARALHLDFLKQHGVSEKAFNAAYDSAAVTDGVAFAERLTSDLSVAGVPLLVVHGKYTTNVSQAGGERQLFSLIDDLAAREKQRR